MSDTAADVIAALAAAADPDKAIGLSRFFKTGPGDYGRGDVFLGLPVPPPRRLMKPYRSLPMDQIDILLDSAVHEHRFVGLLILVAQYPSNSGPGADFYL